MSLKRRQTLGYGAAALAASAFGAQARAASGPRPFKLKYAPHPGMFKASAPGGVLDEIRFAADQGFTAWEDNALHRRPPDEQEKIARELQRAKMTLGIFVLNPVTGFKEGGTLTTGDPAARAAFLDEVKRSIEVARRVGGRWMTSLVGMSDPRLPPGYQLANVVDCVRRAADLLEPHRLVMVFEPLNVRDDHPGFFISTNDMAYALMKAVRSPSCKMLYDFYHSQISEGRLLANFDHCYDEIAYVQTGDSPGRKEPGTGETNYFNVFRHLHRKGYQGLVGMEHGSSKPGKAGDLAVIAAYRAADGF
jgi:hydroxypyruvate isomerase